MGSDLNAVDQLDTSGGTSNGTGCRTMPSGTPSSRSLNSTDLNILAKTSYSPRSWSASWPRSPHSRRIVSDVQLYAEKFIADHEQEVIHIGQYAQATHTYLPAWIQGDDVHTSQHVLAAVNIPSYDTTYLTTMVQSHTMDIQDNQNNLKITKNPTLRQFAMDDIPTDWMHRAAAQFLLSELK